MVCSKCNKPMRIVKAEYKTENDNSPDEQTKLFRVLTLECEKCGIQRQKLIELPL